MIMDHDFPTTTEAGIKSFDSLSYNYIIWLFAYW